MADDEMGIAEIGRMARDAIQQLRELPDRYVVRREYDRDQQNTTERIGGLVGGLAQTQTKVELIQNAQADAETARVVEQAKRDKERNDAAAARRWQLFLLFAGPIAAVLASDYFTAGTP